LPTCLNANWQIGAASRSPPWRKAESGRRDLPVGAIAHAAETAGLRLVLVDDAGKEVPGMTPHGVRDMSGRRFPAHLDTRYGDQGWWYTPHRYDRPQPWYTFDRDRYVRDEYRAWRGTPQDHLLPQPGDAPEERAAARRRALLEARAAERERAFLAGELARRAEDFDCSCPPACDELDDRSGKPVHADDCPCGCDVA
jgi:HTH-type transcriptional regulator/antitoxin HipB